MAKRGKISKRMGNKAFKGGQRVHPKNASPNTPMRGGHRL